MNATETRLLTIPQWRELAQNGTVLPMRIPLDGDSMRPLIRRGRDRVTFVPLDRQLKRGDVVLFEYPAGRYVAHRIFRISSEQMKTLGDHCWNPEPWLPVSAVLGLAIQVERGKRTIPLDCPFMRALGRIWMALLPLRRGYWKVRALAGKALRKDGLRR